jgi:hypothetical protein
MASALELFFGARMSTGGFFFAARVEPEAAVHEGAAARAGGDVRAPAAAERAPEEYAGDGAGRAAAPGGGVVPEPPRTREGQAQRVRLRGAPPALPGPHRREPPPQLPHPGKLNPPYLMNLLPPSNFRSFLLTIYNFSRRAKGWVTTAAT